MFCVKDNENKGYFAYEFDRNLQSLIQTFDLADVIGIVFGRFAEDCKLELSIVERIIRNKSKLRNIPIVFNVDFGHVHPHNFTFPIGGIVRVEANKESVAIEILQH